MEVALAVPVDRDSEELQMQRAASLYLQHEEARNEVEYEPRYYDVNWYLKRLDSIANSAENEGKHPAAVSAVRTMAEIVGLLGPLVNANIDARTQILQLPEGISEETLIALATGAYNEAPTGDG